MFEQTGNLSGAEKTKIDKKGEALTLFARWLTKRE